LFPKKIKTFTCSPSLMSNKYPKLFWSLKRLAFTKTYFLFRPNAKQLYFLQENVKVCKTIHPR